MSRCLSIYMCVYVCMFATSPLHEQDVAQGHF